MSATKLDTTIQSLGECTYVSPLKAAANAGHNVPFRTDADKILHNDRGTGTHDEVFEAAGPREKLYFKPGTPKVAIVTCGGLCPGLNDVIRGIVNHCMNRYGVTHVKGIRFGYEGLLEERFDTATHHPINLTPPKVAQIHQFGGTILGSSRGKQDIDKMVDALVALGTDILFVIGGDGSLGGAKAIADKIKERGLKIAVVGIPKTIDNDIKYVDKCFGFETAFAEAVKVLRCAQAEAEGCMNGIGVVKLMGRESGFIACYAALAASNVDFVLIPEVPFSLSGERGLFQALRKRLEDRRSAVIVVAEGAGQDLMPEQMLGTDESGNRKLGNIGQYLQQRITDYFRENRIKISLKYIDPSYIIRSGAANAQDNVYCSQLALHAVHAAMAGKTSMFVGRWHGSFVNLPLHLAAGGRRKVDAHGELWNSVLDTTQQDILLG